MRAAAPAPDAAQRLRESFTTANTAMTATHSTTTINHADELAALIGLLDGRDEIWREHPVGLAEFVTSPEHLGLPPLFPRQLTAITALLGTEPTLIFEDGVREHQLGVLLWGKGSGKDYLCSITVCYLVYVLLCLRDPQAYFGFGKGEPIDVINVAYNADQANKVFFEKLKQRLLGWRWLGEHYNVHERGRRVGTHHDSHEPVHITDRDVIFPRQLRCLSRHSENEAYEGYNVVAWIMDEASAFLSKLKRENADAIYQTLRTSAASRFQRRWVGFIISYPRHGDDFTMTKHREAMANPQLGIYADGPATTWEVNERLGRGEFVEVRDGHLVPVELANDYLLDYEAALARYECRPPAARDAFFRFPERIEAAVARGRAPLVEWEPIVTTRTIPSPDGEGTITRRFRGVRILRADSLPKGTKVYFHGDPGLSNDSFALVLAHGVPATIEVMLPAREVMDAAALAAHVEAGGDPDGLVAWERDVARTVIDAVIVWRPDPRRDMQVDLQNVEDVIFELKDVYKLGHPAPKPTGTFDHWNSALTIQRMLGRRMNVEDEHWTRGFQLDIYRNARTSFYNDLVTLPDTPSVTSTDPMAPGGIYELKRIEFVDGSKIDHPEGGSKDIADAIVRAIQHVTDADRKGFSFGLVPANTAANPSTAPMIANNRPLDSVPKLPARLKERDAERLIERPLGELSPAEGSVNGRRFGSVRSR